MILALDIATSTGWAVSRPGAAIPLATRDNVNEPIIDSGVWHLPSGKSDRIVGLWHHILDTGSKHRVSAICAEAPFMGKSAKVIMTLAELGGVARLISKLQRIPFYLVQPSEIKKFATSKGNASKDDMIHAGELRGWDVEDDNEADARWLSLLAIDRGWGKRPK